MLHLKFMAPDKVLFKGEIDHLVAKTIDGDVAIYNNHIGLVTSLDISVLKLVLNDNSVMKFTISGGYLHVDNNQIVILTKSGENLKNIDRKKAEIKKQKIEEMMKTTSNNSELEKLEVRLKKQLNRINQ